MNIGERIKNRRKELGLSVDDVANSLGKNRATVYRYESNEIENLPITILEPLSKILKTTTGYLMGWTDEHSLEQMNPLTGKKMTKVELNQYEKIMNESALLFDDEDVSDEDKEKLMLALNDLFWKSKQKNKEKYAKSHSKK